MQEYLRKRHEAITNVATIAREMLEDIDCGNWTWEQYVKRIHMALSGNARAMRKFSPVLDWLDRVKRSLITFFKTFLNIFCFFAALFLWATVLFGLFQLGDGDITLMQYIMRGLGASACTAVIWEKIAAIDW